MNEHLASSKPQMTSTGAGVWPSGDRSSFVEHLTGDGPTRVQARLQHGVGGHVSKRATRPIAAGRLAWFPWRG